MRNARDYLGVLYGSVPDLKYELKAVNNFSLTVSEFEKNWQHMLRKYKMQNNPQLKLMMTNEMNESQPTSIVLFVLACLLHKEVRVWMQ
jgi:hypothetical protein